MDIQNYSVAIGSASQPNNTSGKQNTAAVNNDVYSGDTICISRHNTSQNPKFQSTEFKSWLSRVRKLFTGQNASVKQKSQSSESKNWSSWIMGGIVGGGLLIGLAILLHKKVLTTPKSANEKPKHSKNAPQNTQKNRSNLLTISPPPNKEPTAGEGEHADWARLKHVSGKPLDLKFNQSDIPNIEEIDGCSILQSRKSQQTTDFDKMHLTNPPSITYKGKVLELERLGSGGTKETFLTTMDGQKVALAITKDTTTTNKWREALQEVERTREIRAKGLFVNDYSEVVPIEINGYPFPAIAMKPFQDHNFGIYDSKSSSSNPKNEFKWSNKNDVNAMTNDLLGALHDIHVLSKNGIFLNYYDSINLAVKSGRPRIYVMDIPYAKEQNIIFKNETEFKENRRRITERALEEAHYIIATGEEISQNPVFQEQIMKNLTSKLDEIAQKDPSYKNVY